MICEQAVIIHPHLAPLCSFASRKYNAVANSDTGIGPCAGIVRSINLLEGCVRCRAWPVHSVSMALDSSLRLLPVLYPSLHLLVHQCPRTRDVLSSKPTHPVGPRRYAVPRRTTAHRVTRLDLNTSVVEGYVKKHRIWSPRPTSRLSEKRVAQLKISSMSPASGTTLEASIWAGERLIPAYVF